jgi:hypothetical protein
MARTTLVKPGKENLLVPMGRGKNINEAIAGMKGGETRSGYLGTGENLLKKPGYVAMEDLSQEEKEQKRLLQELLGKVIEPNALSTKSSPEMDRRSLIGKLKKSLMDDLLKLVPKSIKEMSNEELRSLVSSIETMDEADKAEIQSLYMDVSP